MKETTLTIKIDQDLLVAPEITMDLDGHCDIVLEISPKFGPCSQRVKQWYAINCDVPFGTKEETDRLIKFIKDAFS